METNQNLTSIKRKLPHGAIADIAKRAGVLAPTVSRALKGDTRSPKLPEITMAVAEYLKEYKAKENEANQALNEALNEALNAEPSEQFTARMNNQREKYGEGISPIL